MVDSKCLGLEPELQIRAYLLVVPNRFKGLLLVIESFFCRFEISIINHSNSKFSELAGDLALVKLYVFFSHY